MSKPKQKYHENPSDLLNTVESEIVHSDIALDVGCGIVPMNYFRPKLHIMVEPFEEYRNILLERHGDDKSVLVLKTGALEAFNQLGDHSIDSIFLLDVIEHLEKDVGFKVISEVERIAREQVVIFTPLGFMPQHMDPGEKDAWGLSGIEMQEHRSGWSPDDFGDGWHFHICKTYHTTNFRGEPLEQFFGAFFAIFTPTLKSVPSGGSLSDIRRPLPSEVELAKTKSELEEVRSAYAGLLSRVQMDDRRSLELEVELARVLSESKDVGTAHGALLTQIDDIQKANVAELDNLRRAFDAELEEVRRDRDELASIFLLRKYRALRRYLHRS